MIFFVCRVLRIEKYIIDSEEDHYVLNLNLLLI
jgi:hypothetical protein